MTSFDFDNKTKYFSIMKKPSLNTTDYLILTGIVLVSLAIHQKFVAPRIAKKA